MSLEEEIECFTRNTSDLIVDSFKSEKSLDPQLWIFFQLGEKLDVTCIPILSNALNSQRGKDIIEAGIIELLASFNHVGILPVCILWATEAWVRGGDPKDIMKDGKLDMNLVERLPKKEVIVLNYETETHTQIVLYEVIGEERNLVPYENEKTGGKQPLSSSGGRFSNFIKRMKEYEW